MASPVVDHATHASKTDSVQIIRNPAAWGKSIHRFRLCEVEPSFFGPQSLPYAHCTPFDLRPRGVRLRMRSERLPVNLRPEAMRRTETVTRSLQMNGALKLFF